MKRNEALLKKRLGDRLRNIRIDKGLSLEQVSNLTGLSINTLHSAELGRTMVKSIHLYYITQVLGYSLDKLFQEVNK